MEPLSSKDLVLCGKRVPSLSAFSRRRRENFQSGKLGKSKTKSMNEEADKSEIKYVGIWSCDTDTMWRRLP